jgi:hypothetical protein
MHISSWKRGGNAFREKDSRKQGTLAHTARALRCFTTRALSDLRERIFFFIFRFFCPLAGTAAAEATSRHTAAHLSMVVPGSVSAGAHKSTPVSEQDGDDKSQMHSNTAYYEKR